MDTWEQAEHKTEALRLQLIQLVLDTIALPAVILLGNTNLRQPKGNITIVSPGEEECTLPIPTMRGSPGQDDEEQTSTRPQREVPQSIDAGRETEMKIHSAKRAQALVRSGDVRKAAQELTSHGVAKRCKETCEVMAKAHKSKVTTTELPPHERKANQDHSK
jgi:hypothetical protein